MQTTDSAGRTTTFTYDTLGQLIERRNHDGTNTSLTYDDRGCLIRIANHAGAVEYTHDALGRVLSETVDGRTTTYTYDLLGRRTSRTTPTGIVSNWTYDANNQPTGVHNTIGALGFAYDAGGRETTRNLGGGAALTQTWDACNRLTGQSIWAYDGAPGADGTFTGVQARTYGYRPDGMPTTIRDQLRGHRTFDLTPAGRITRVTAQSWSETYAYDPPRQHHPRPEHPPIRQRHRGRAHLHRITAAHRRPNQLRARRPRPPHPQAGAQPLRTAPRVALHLECRGPTGQDRHP
ncbi:hypothetical protein M1L21_17095 [Streptomyces sp. AS02]|nr:hypothetical protein [Streptomyces sp. AS02]